MNNLPPSPVTVRHGTDSSEAFFIHMKGTAIMVYFNTDADMIIIVVLLSVILCRLPPQKNRRKNSLHVSTDLMLLHTICTLFYQITVQFQSRISYI